MGYDLEWAILPAPAIEAERCISTLPRGAVCAHDLDCAQVYASAMAPAEYRLNAYSLAVILPTMLATGMCYEADIQPESAFSDVGPMAVDLAPSPGRFRPDFDASFLAWAQQSAPGQTGIPAFKFRSNDWWHVTVPEIHQALAAYERADLETKAQAEATERWTHWMDWLRESRDHGGFLVD